MTDYILFAMAKLRVMVDDVPDADVRAKLVKVGYSQHLLICCIPLFVINNCVTYCSFRMSLMRRYERSS